jgi:hypothetical protein
VLRTSDTAEAALRAQGVTGDHLVSLAHKVATDELRRRGAYLGDRYPDLVSHLLVTGCRAAITYDPTRSGEGYSFMSFLYDILKLRVSDFFRSKGEGFTDRRYAGADTSIVPVGDRIDALAAAGGLVTASLDPDDADLGSAAACVGSRRKRGGLVSPRAVPRFHRDRHPSSSGRDRDRSCDDHGEAPYPCHDRGTKTCSAGRDREGGREGNRWLDDSRARSFPGLRGGLDDPQEDHPDPRESLQNMDSLLQAGRIPGFRLLSRRQRIWRGLGPLAQPRERHDPGDLSSRASSTRLVRICAARCGKFTPLSVYDPVTTLFPPAHGRGGTTFRSRRAWRRYGRP